ncbi:MAG: hypothetical protein HY894_09790 [Deltaproteobacteria bacterium]|nr:hypothetical protein [Deltaproteobacteria bacterium]
MRTFAIYGWLIVSLFVLTPVVYAAESDTDKLLDLLVEKGAVNKEEAAGLRADSAIRKQAEKEGQKEFAVIAGRPLRLSGYAQVRCRRDEAIKDTFDVRRARLDLKGEITERFGYRLQVDFAGASAKLLDASIGYQVEDYLKLMAGQFKVPFSQENLASSPQLETINRSQAVEALVARGKDVISNHNGRDTGLQASGGLWRVDSGYFFDYALGVFNGTGINASDANEQRD